MLELAPSDRPEDPPMVVDSLGVPLISVCLETWISAAIINASVVRNPCPAVAAPLYLAVATLQQVSVQLYCCY